MKCFTLKLIQECAVKAENENIKHNRKVICLVGQKKLRAVPQGEDQGGASV